MPEKYHIKAAATPGRFRRVGKFGSVDWREDCSRCTNCVKPRCVYDTYKKEAVYNRDPSTSVVPLYEALDYAADRAATEDPRFPPITPANRQAQAG